MTKENPEQRLGMPCHTQASCSEGHESKEERETIKYQQRQHDISEDEREPTGIRSDKEKLTKRKWPT